MTASTRATQPSVDASLAQFRGTGDTAALAEVFDLAAPELFRLALAWTPDAASAEDALQETFLATFDAVRTWDPSRPAMPWLAGILRHKAEHVRRRVRREPDPLRVVPPVGAPDPASEAERRDELDRVRAAIAALPEPYRAVAVMRWRYGLEPAEIAEIRGEPPGTVRSTLTRALRKLRDGLRGPSAGFAWFVGGAEPRGLGVVRDAVLREAARHAAVSGSAAASGAAALGGLVIMKKAMIAAVALLLVAGAAVVVNEFGAPPDPPSPQVPSAVAVVAHPARAKPETPRDEPLADGLPSPIDLAAVDRDRDLHGIVVRSDGSPVAGAAVVAVTYPWRRTCRLNHAEYRTAVPGPSTRSAKDGTFALRLARGDCVALRVSAAGLAPVEMAMRHAGGRVRVVMTEGVAVRVTVTDAANAPLAGATIEASDDGQGTTTTYRRCATDASGVALIDSLPARERLFVVCNLPGRAGSGVQEVDLPQSGETALNVVLRAGRTLRGRVTDSETGAPVAGAEVGLGWDGDRAVPTLGDGTYTLPGLAEKGDERVSVTAEGYAGAGEVAGSRDVVDFSLRRGFAATGRIVGADGASVAGALVAAVASPSENGGAMCMSSGFATTAADGRFRIPNLDRALRHVLTVTAAQRGRVCVAVPAPEPRADADLGDVTLPAARSIEGSVLDAASKPAADVRVIASGPLGADSGPPLWRTDERMTDDLGRFRFGDLAPGRYLVIASPVGAPRTQATVDVPAGSDVRDLVFSQSGTRSLIVRVVDDAGAPVARVVVDASGRNGAEYARALTADDGTTTLTVGTNALFAHAYAPYGSERAFLPCAMQTLRADTAEISFVLREGAWLAGRLLDPDGKPIARALVRVRSGQDDQGIASTSEDGRFRRAVPRGASCSVSFDGIVGGRDTDLAAHADVATPGVDVVLTCERVATGRTIRGVVVGKDGRGVRAVAAARSGADERFYVSDVTADDGTFTLRVSAGDPGPFRVSARFTDSSPGAEDADVDGVAPGATDVRIVMPR